MKVSGHFAENYAELPLRQRKDIESRYREKHRSYHATRHIEELFVQYDRFFSHMVRPDLVGFAILYHDAVYDTDKPDADNVRASADLFIAHVREFNLGYDKDEIEAVEQMIMSTAGHKLREPHHPYEGYEDDVRLFLDFDLSSLAAPTETFNRATQKIRFEYPQYPDAIFAAGRASVLQTFSERDPLFLHPATHRFYEDKAKDNLRQSVEFLSAEAARLRGDPNDRINWPAPKALP